MHEIEVAADVELDRVCQEEVDKIQTPLTPRLVKGNGRTTTSCARWTSTRTRCRRSWRLLIPQMARTAHCVFRGDGVCFLALVARGRESVSPVLVPRESVIVSPLCASSRDACMGLQSRRRHGRAIRGVPFNTRRPRRPAYSQQHEEAST